MPKTDSNPNTAISTTTDGNTTTVSPNTKKRNPQTDLAYTTLVWLMENGYVSATDPVKPYIVVSKTVTDESGSTHVETANVELRNIAGTTLGHIDRIARALNPDGDAAVRLAAAVRAMKAEGYSAEDILARLTSLAS